MSSNASAGAREESSGSDEYAWLLDQVDTAIEEAHRKIESGRVYDADNEKVRIKWIRALAYAANVRRQIARDRDLEELAERIDELERRQEARR